MNYSAYMPSVSGGYLYMRKFFSPESPAMRFLSLFCDWILLNVLFIICCLPIITIGTSITALYAVLFRKLRGEDCFIAKTFFKEFKSNFKQSILFWIPFLLIEAFLIFDIYIVRMPANEAYLFLQYPVSIVAFLILCGSIFVFPQMALFDSKTPQIIKNSFLLGLSNFPTVILILVVYIALFLVAGLSPKWTAIIFSIMLFFGFAATANFCCLFYRRIFIKCLGLNEDGSDPDEAEEEEL